MARIKTPPATPWAVRGGQGIVKGLNTLLLMSELFPNDRNNYKALFLKEWDYINTYLINPGNGNWYPNGIDKQYAMKAPIWKGNYHTSRSRLNCTKRLAH